VNDLYRTTRDHATGAKAKIFVAVTGVFVNLDSLGYLADKDGRTHEMGLTPDDGRTELQFIGDPTSSDLEVFRHSLSECQLIIISDPGNPEDDPRVNVTQILPQTLPLVRSNPDFELLATCPTFGGKNYYVYHRRDSGK
jgi:hypothetical protein